MKRDERYESLLDAAASADTAARQRSDIAALLDDASLGFPSRVHDWRNHLPSAIKAAWPSLSPESRAVAFILASGLAQAEDWDSR